MILNFDDGDWGLGIGDWGLVLILILVCLQFVVFFLKNREQDVNSSINNTLQAGVSYSLTFIAKKNTLKFRYLVAYVLTRAAMWSKAPYLYTLYSTVHGFSISEIGVLYIIDAVSAFIAGPITGNLADKYGRKLFCQFYNISVIFNLLLRMTGSKTLAYVSQVVTGIGGGLINTTFESWLVSEARKEFGDREVERERFLKKLFKTQTILDAVMSIVISAFTAIIYSLFGIFVALSISIAFSLIGIITTGYLWSENKAFNSNNVNHSTSMVEVWGELKKREVLSIGIIESIFQAVFNIYLFSWTPLLESSTPTEINVGFVFTCFVITMILGTTLYEIFLIYLRTGYYESITVALFFETGLFFGIYYFDNFLIRLILLACVNGVTGFYSPLNSIIKSRILVEKFRALLMSIFRIPLNLYVIIVLVCLRYLDPLVVCLIAGSMMFLAFCVSLTLAIWKPTAETAY